MGSIVSINSYRKGVGKSHAAANISVLLTEQGKRVALVDADLDSPGAYYLFGLKEDEVKYTLNDYLLGKCSIKETAINLSPRLKTKLAGQLFLITGRNSYQKELSPVFHQGTPAHLLKEAFRALEMELALDCLIIDTQAGLSQTTLLLMALSKVLAVMMSLDQQDYQGTGVTVEIARKLDVPRTVLIVNNAPSMFSFDDIRTEVEQTYHCPVVAVLPYAEELLSLMGLDVFVLRYPNHPLTAELKGAALMLTS